MLEGALLLHMDGNAKRIVLQTKNHIETKVVLYVWQPLSIL